MSVLGSMVSDEQRLQRLLELSSSVYEADQLSSLQARYLRAIPTVLEADAYGFYALDGVSQPLAVTTVGAPAGFLSEYEGLGRARDPLFEYACAHRTPVHSGSMFTADRWKSEPLYDLMHEWAFEHSLQGALSVGKQVIGTLNFARARHSQPFNESDLGMLGWVCLHVSTAMRQVQTVRRAEAETCMLRTALESISVPVVITNGSGDVLKANRAAHTTILSHRRGPALKSSSGRAVAENIARLLQTDESSVASSVEPNGTGDMEFLVRTSAAPASLGYYFSTFSPALPRRSPVSESAVLSTREQQIAKLVAEGYSNQQIADRLFVTVNTIKDHLKRMHRKLEVASRAEIAAWAQRHLDQL